MSKLGNIVKWETLSGDRTTIGDVAVTPQSQALTIRWPNGGMVWNRPVAVLVEQDGETERVPIVDVTLCARLGLLGLSAAFLMATIFLSARNRRNQDV